MFGYTVPSYGKLSPKDGGTYRRYYCEGCHQLRSGYGLCATLAANYDMTFNTILLNGITADCPDFEGTSRRLCVLDPPKADSELMRKMASYTVILTKWELYDDEVDSPTAKTKMISFLLGKAIRKACESFPEFDNAVGEAFSRLREMEMDGYRDTLSMGRAFGEGLTIPLDTIAGGLDNDAKKLFAELTACVYLMDAVDDLDEDFLRGTYNPLLPERGFVNALSFLEDNIFAVTETVSEAIGGLQRSYAKVRRTMRGNVRLCDNIVYHGIPESAKRVISGNSSAKASIKNVVSNRKERVSRRLSCE